MSFSPDNAAAWAAEQMRQKTGVVGVEMRTARSFLVSRREHPPYIAGIVAVTDVTAAHVGEVLAMDGAFDLVFLNDPNGKATPSAKDAAQALGIPILAAKEWLARIGRP